MGRGLVRGKGPKARPGGLALEEGSPGRPPLGPLPERALPSRAAQCAQAWRQCVITQK